MKEAKNTVTQIIEDTWNEYTGDVNNILMMDAGAEAVSLTAARSRKAGPYHLMTGQNPVYLFTFQRKETAE